MAVPAPLPRAEPPRLSRCLVAALVVHATFFSLVAGAPAATNASSWRDAKQPLDVVLAQDPLPVPEREPEPPTPPQTAQRVASATARESSAPAAPIESAHADSAPASGAFPATTAAIEPTAPTESAVVVPAPALVPPNRSAPSPRTPIPPVDMDVAHAAAISGRTKSLSVEGRDNRIGGLAGDYGVGGGVARLHRSTDERAELEDQDLTALKRKPPRLTLAPFADEPPGGAGRWYYERITRRFKPDDTARYGVSLSGDAVALVLVHQLGADLRPVHSWRLLDRLTPSEGARHRLDLATSVSLTAGTTYLFDVLSVYHTGARYVHLVLLTPDGEEHNFIRLHPRNAGTPVKAVLERMDTQYLNPHSTLQSP